MKGGVGRRAEGMGGEGLGWKGREGREGKGSGGEALGPAPYTKFLATPLTR